MCKTISLCAIAKNEEETCQRWFDSFKPIADEIIFVDTGSTDKTIEIAKANGAQVFQKEWRDNFSYARNLSFLQGNMDYLMWADLDDILTPINQSKLLEAKKTLNKTMYLMKYDYAQDKQGKSLSILWRERLIKRENFCLCHLVGGQKDQDCLFWQYPVHECIMLHPDYEKLDVTITHKRTASQFATDHGRNIRILDKALGRNNETHLQRYPI